MKNINFPMLFLAATVILMFVLVGLAIALRSGWLVLVFLILGFAFMGYGISLKKKRK